MALVQFRVGGLLVQLFLLIQRGRKIPGFAMLVLGGAKLRANRWEKARLLCALFS